MKGESLNRSSKDGQTCFRKRATPSGLIINSVHFSAQTTDGTESSTRRATGSPVIRRMYNCGTYIRVSGTLPKRISEENVNEGPGARFSKVPIINGPGKLSPFSLKIEVSIVLHVT